MADTCNKSGMVTFRQKQENQGIIGLLLIRNWPIKVKIPFLSLLVSPLFSWLHLAGFCLSLRAELRKVRKNPLCKQWM